MHTKPIVYNIVVVVKKYNTLKQPSERLLLSTVETLATHVTCPNFGESGSRLDICQRVLSRVEVESHLEESLEYLINIEWMFPL